VATIKREDTQAAPDQPSLPQQALNQAGHFILKVERPGQFGGGWVGRVVSLGGRNLRLKLTFAL
jgi:hypothetical protein